LPSLTDQIFIKISRIRTLQEATERMIDEDEKGEFIAIVNYSIMALIQLELGFADQPDLTDEEAIIYYDKYAIIAHDLMLKKNHDYGEAWRDMRISSITDLIYQKV
ncbi:MAG: nucleotide modification associated domain-containing protein, partial [Algoriella sp.]